VVERSIPGEPGLQVLGNAIATGLALGAMILAFAPVSGAHFNPAVTMSVRLGREVTGVIAGVYILAQLAGAAIGTMLANAMFELPLVTLSTTTRTGWNLWVSEIVATFGLVLVIRLVGRRGRPAETALVVAAYVTAGILFTSSTCFANPAVTLGRMLTDTFSGVAPSSVPAFVVRNCLARCWRWGVRERC
jgi:glycerol uptake facilitator-like aquaporin